MTNKRTVLVAVALFLLGKKGKRRGVSTGELTEEIWTGDGETDPVLVESRPLTDDEGA